MVRAADGTGGVDAVEGVDRVDRIGARRLHCAPSRPLRRQRTVTLWCGVAGHDLAGRRLRCGMSRPPATLLCFGPFTLDLTAAQLRRDGAEVALRPKAYELLVALARRPQELVTKEELLDSVWGRRFITEGVIKSSVSELRQALGDDPKAPRWIETVSRRGYRFGSAVNGCLGTADAPIHAPIRAPIHAVISLPINEGPASVQAPAQQPLPAPGNVPALLEIGRASCRERV